MNIAVFGLGRWGPNHLRVFSSMPKVRVVAAADPDESSRKRIELLYPGVYLTARSRDLLDRDDIDAVVIATPTHTHHKLVKAALESGKHVLCEKPLATKGRDAWQLVEMAEERNLYLMVGHVFLFNPGITYIADMMKKDGVGRIYYLNAIRTNLGPFRYDVNAAWDLASHDIYIFNYLLQKRPLSVSAMGECYLQKNIQDLMFLTLEYEGGILGHIHVSWLDPKKLRQITLVGEKKMITWDDMGVPGPVMVHDRSVEKEPRYDTFGEFQLLAREGDVVLPRIPTKEPLAAQARAFMILFEKDAKQILDRGSAEEGAIIVDVLAAADRSLREHGKCVKVRYGR